MKELMQKILGKEVVTANYEPQFTAPAKRLWTNVPDPAKTRLLNNVWCGYCRHLVTITNYSGRVIGGDLLLAGLCADCLGNVARVVEMS